MPLRKSSMLQCIVAISSITSLCVILCRSHSSEGSFRHALYYTEKDSLQLGFNFNNSPRHLNVGSAILKCVFKAAECSDVHCLDCSID